ncbi:MAG: hypothetical protein QE290_19200 [Acidovorax sp.]|uniref:hypothetical protein n=1 Tax=Acidovorax sp. TaxID=1872122 RepID=UPI0026275C5D|nr:hypothetical protein [Acidovorax sp.]MDH4466160.1 hypothetical protein [Acidovorax sp.]
MDAAQILYGGATPTTPAAQPDAQVETTAAQRLYGGATPAAKPAAPAEQHVPEPSTKLFDARHAETPFSRAVQTASMERMGLLPGDAVVAASEWNTTVQNLGLDDTTAVTLSEIALGVLDGGVAYTEAEGRVAAVAAVSQAFGSQAEHVLNLARVMVSKDPGLSRWLDETGLGSHPKYVIEACHRARALHLSGKL